MSEHAIDRPTHACILCPPPRREGHWRPADPGYKTCAGCLDRLRDRLQEIVARWHQLDPTPGAYADHAGRGAPGYNSRPPASDHIIAMTDRRSSPTAHVWVAADGRVHHEHEHPPLSVWNVLNTCGWDVAELRGIDGPPASATVADLAAYLDRHLDWITRREQAADLHTALRSLLTQLRPATGDPAPRHIGLCPGTETDDGTHQPCGARLYAPLRGDEIRCTTCNNIWPRDTWLQLGDLLGEAS